MKLPEHKGFSKVLHIAIRLLSNCIFARIQGIELYLFLFLYML